MNAHFQRALELHRSGKLRQAAAAYEQGLGIESDNADAFHMAGLVAFQTGHFAKAADYLSRATTLNPNNYEMQVNLGSALWRGGDPAAALEALERGLQLNPGCPEAHVLAGHCLLQQERTTDAEAAFRKALSLRPAWADALEGLATALFALGDDEAALARVKDALASEPKRATAHRLMGDVLQRRLDFGGAIDAYNAALALDPNDSAAHDHLGLALTKADRTKEAISHYRKAVKLRPDDPVTRHSLGLALLALGRFEEGWPLFADRHGARNGFLADRAYAAPPITTGAFANKRLLVWTDQGIGEQIMFASLVPDLLAKNAKLALECDARLVPLFERSFAGVDVIPRRTPPDPRVLATYGGQSALADLARWLRPSFDAFPRRAYLRAAPDQVAALRARYAQPGKRLVGLSWRTQIQANAKLSPQKTLALNEWTPLLSREDAVFVNLQYGDCAAEIAEIKSRFGVHIINDPQVDPLTDLDAFAAQVCAMDAVVTVSNSSAHMAGALGVPVWTLVPCGYGALWHWFTERSDSPWYPSMRLIRQTSVAMWDGLVEDATSQLTAHFATRNE